MKLGKPYIFGSGSNENYNHTPHSDLDLKIPIKIDIDLEKYQEICLETIMKERKEDPDNNVMTEKDAENHIKQRYGSY